MKKLFGNSFLALVLAMTMIMGMSLNVMAATYSTDNSEYAGGMLVRNFRAVPKSGPMVELAEGDIICAGMEIYVSSDATVYVDNVSVENKTILSKDAKVVSLDVDGKVMKLETEPDPSTCEHTWSEWKYAPSHGDEWRYCSKCHTEERRAVASSSNSSSSKPTEPTEPTKTDIEVREAVEETLPVSPVSVDATQFNKADAAIIPGGTYNLSNFITTKGIVKGINTAVAAANNNKKDVAEIYTGKPFCFNKEIIKAIQEGNKTVVYYFQYQGHVYSVTVPATVDASKVLEKAGFAGPLYVGQQLGTTKLVK